MSVWLEPETVSALGETAMTPSVEDAIERLRAFLDFVVNIVAERILDRDEIVDQSVAG